MFLILKKENTHVARVQRAEASLPAAIQYSSQLHDFTEKLTVRIQILQCLVGQTVVNLNRFSSLDK
jgi:hypothetical protein